MTKLKTLALVTAMVGASALASAADTSVTITTRKAPQPVGTSPVVGFVHATANASSTTNGFTFDIPAPRGTANITGVIAQATTVSGSVKPLQIIRVGRTFNVSSSNMTSGTIAVGDVVRAIIVYTP